MVNSVLVDLIDYERGVKASVMHRYKLELDVDLAGGMLVCPPPSPSPNKLYSTCNGTIPDFSPVSLYFFVYSINWHKQILFRVATRKACILEYFKMLRREDSGSNSYSTIKMRLFGCPIFRF